ncbi:hypothetical protein [Streptomyces sp. SID12488]|uniref:hypothetical protein n=1 Tax=Streptomyces sp. SID12488 TaxID=2706040 RepID=UPI0013DAC517|nr:hypothetical protein [Streptomyces sp. SID12488]NEA62052.1 hypothetical protein [Streptomyces sp. SID12488]
MNVQVLRDPFGRPLGGASPALPGTVHDIKTIRTHGMLDALAEAVLDCWDDRQLDTEQANQASVRGDGREEGRDRAGWVGRSASLDRCRAC